MVYLVKSSLMEQLRLLLPFGLSHQEGIWKREFPEKRGELSIFQTHHDSPGTWNNEEVNFKVIHKKDTQGSHQQTFT